MGILAPVLLASLLNAVPPGDECTDLQRPATFDTAAAMLAVFCRYDREHERTLLPIQYTSPWNPRRAETLASPMLVTTFRERGALKGLLVVQRQRMSEGEPSTGHAEGAIASVHVFRQASDVRIREAPRGDASSGGFRLQAEVANRRRSSG